MEIKGAPKEVDVGEHRRDLHGSLEFAMTDKKYKWKVKHFQEGTIFISQYKANGSLLARYQFEDMGRLATVLQVTRQMEKEIE